MKRYQFTIWTLALLLCLTVGLAGCSAAQPVGSAAPSATPMPAPTTAAPSATPGSLDEARDLIADWLKREVPGFNLDILSGLQQTDLGLEHLEELTGTRIYSLGSYLFTLHGGNVSRLYCLTVLEARLEDMDGDGAIELVLLCDNGSGLHVYQLFIVKNGEVHAHTIESTANNHRYSLGTMCSCGVLLLKEELKDGQETGPYVVGQITLKDGKVVVE